MNCQRLLNRLFKSTKKESVKTMTMIKVNKPVMQEVEVSKEEVIRDLLGTTKTKFGFGDLVYVNSDEGFYNAENALGVVTRVEKSSYNPITGDCWDKDYPKKERLAYTVIYKKIDGVRQTGNFTAENLTAVS